MEQRSRVKVAGTPRAVLAVATGALVALASGATAFVVLTGTAAVVRPGPNLMPLPPFAAPSDQPVVLLPPGALGTAPRGADRPSVTGRTSGTAGVALAQRQLRQRRPQLPPNAGRSPQRVELPPLAVGRVTVLPTLTPGSRPSVLAEASGPTGNRRGVLAHDSGTASGAQVEVVEPVEGFLFGQVSVTEQELVAAFRVGPESAVDDSEERSADPRGSSLADAAEKAGTTSREAADRPARADRPDRPAKTKAAKAEKRAKAATSKTRKAEKARKFEKAEKPQKAQKAEKPQKAQKAQKPEKAQKAGRNAKTD